MCGLLEGVIVMPGSGPRVPRGPWIRELIHLIQFHVLRDKRETRASSNSPEKIQLKRYEYYFTLLRDFPELQFTITGGINCINEDESTLIWYSGKEEKQLKISHVSRIIPGQRTAIFQRYPRPEKEYQSFSLIYNDRSLDLICKDKDEAEVWFVGLKALICRGNNRKWRTESKSDRALFRFRFLFCSLAFAFSATLCDQMIFNQRILEDHDLKDHA
ncbi:hypothetical protein QJS04_geneDACA014853 [Acorus gramineus]|uniref:PH domain-containing protein n=1 Tax=Acorus gramineus TaxID=55184 RepID=A0AAV9A2Y3_ACOGR|nr:hypothetical protein QJS04_geneDACA014853 [Acorus gramineus]